MKKTLSITFALLLMTVVASSAATSSTDGKLTLTVDTGDDAFSVGLSPEVSMFHESNGTAPTGSQWYAISAGHPGGNRAYGTAQDVNNIYYRDYTTAAELSTYLQSIPEDDTASGIWTSDWKQ